MARKVFRTTRPTEGIEFELNDIVFHCRPQMAAGAIFAFVDTMTSDDDDDETATSPRRSLHAVMDFYRAALPPDEFLRFEALINDPDVAVQISDLAEIAGWLSGQYTGRTGPTQEASSDTSSPTPSGPDSTDGPLPGGVTYFRPEPAAASA